MFAPPTAIYTHGSGIWPLGHIGHVTYSFINILFISTGIFDDKLRPHIWSVGITANTPLTATEYLYHKWPRICWYEQYIYETVCHMTNVNLRNLNFRIDFCSFYTDEEYYF
jgi:hypothetical protein